MLEPLRPHASRDVKFHDSFSVFNWGRMPDLIPHRGKFYSLLETYLQQKISSVEHWNIYLRSADALAFRKAATPVLKNGQVTAHLNELADLFPIKTDFNSTYKEENFQMVQVMGRAGTNFSSWKKSNGPKSLPFEFECEFLDKFPQIELRCSTKNNATKVSISEALLITEFEPELLETVMLQAAWIAGFIQYQLSLVLNVEEKKTIHVRMGLNDEYEFVFLGSSVSFSEIELTLEKFYSSTIWGKTVLSLQQKGYSDWKKHCSEPAPWLDQGLKISLSDQYQKMISGIESCL